jgi:AraC family transcriptional regulator
MKVVVIVKASKASEAGEMPSAEMFAAMEKFNEELINAGIMLDGTGLTPSSRGARVRFSGSNRTVIDGPFAETTELIAGFWIWKVSSLQEAIDWVKKCPNPMLEDSDIEIRPLMEPEDFAGLVTPERLEEVKELEARSGDRDGYGLARFK